ncbi:7TM GPCR serpentine receptor class x (Srx) domain-containing protein [Caenorhabditis elegans]|uniref:7TM GPCR serpentine receptor class x (Srx) domain-containing protein n=1 Tax=Caenorhabditis elegans TaxID=6239 RepID=F1LIN1_CAEEL|nr:7TM GPCR serpentine receptor class x (Srx) domain-containing protein [Caenorhabditis elegans]CBZ42123.1 7TM GPCR serpentine receptor class x (Srx) domain-containing protein [Caenorhabditis elegans]|eukprot:NP_001256337.1 Serpentine Receptor, class X [Caenorhabditis elegans]
MDDTPLPNYTDPINILAAVFIFVNGIMGTVTNLLIIYIFIKSPTERTSFNVICVFRGIGNTIILTWGFLATFLPITLIFGVLDGLYIL